MFTVMGDTPRQWLPTRFSRGARLSVALVMEKVNEEFTVTVWVARSTWPVMGPFSCMEKVAVASGMPASEMVLDAGGQGQVAGQRARGQVDLADEGARRHRHAQVEALEGGGGVHRPVDRDDGVGRGRGCGGGQTEAGEHQGHQDGQAAAADTGEHEDLLRCRVRTGRGHAGHRDARRCRPRGSRARRRQAPGTRASQVLVPPWHSRSASDPSTVERLLTVTVSLSV